MDLGCIDMGCVEKQRKENSVEKQNSPKESVMSASKIGGKNIRAKDAVRFSLNALTKLTSQITKPPHRKTSPINWFPRKKVEPYLNRKIKMLQEVDGMYSTLDETLGDSNPHYSRVLREKIAIREAAEKAMDARKTAMMEASWCRILQAARIESKEAEAQLSKAEAAAAEACEAAREVGIIMNDVPESSENHYKIKTSNKGGEFINHSVSATFETAFEVNKQVAAAVKSAFIKLANCSSINKDEFKDLLWKISENPDSDETFDEFSSDFDSECESDIVEMMLDRLRCLKEDELASLATIVATCGLSAALTESKNIKNPFLNKEPRPSIAEVPSLDKFLVKRLTRLEREVLEAKNARKNEALEVEEAKMKNDSKLCEVNNKKFLRGIAKQEAEEIPSLDKFLVKHMTRLDKEVDEVRNGTFSAPTENNSVITDEGSSEKENTDLNKIEDKFFSRENSCQGQKRGNSETDYESLDKVLVKYVSKLERAKLEFNASDQMGMKFRHKGINKEPESIESLDKVLVKHVSKLERAKLEFSASEGTEMKLRHKKTVKEPECSESLDKVLIKHVSKLERAKLEFGAGEQTGMTFERKEINRKPESSKGSLDEVLVKHKSRLEREKMEAAEKREDDDGIIRHSVSRRKARERELENAWGGLSLGNSIQPHVSRLQRDKAAWLKSEDEERKREMERV